MALDAVQQNIISEEMQIAEELLKLADRMKALRARFDLNDTYNESSDQEELGQTFPHLTQSKIGNGFNTFDAVIDALGDATSGNAAALYLLKG